MSKTILVTGSNGFIGTNLVKQLINSGYNVIEFDIHIGEISNYVFPYDKIDHIFHLASLTFVPQSWEKPVDFYKTNVIGTANILELCRKHFCSLTYISSYVYGNPTYLPVDEKHPIEPVSPYNHSKILAEELCKFYAINFNIEITILRPTNIYGSGQNTNFLIPMLIEKTLNETVKTIEVMDLRPKRDYLYLNDFLDALLLTINKKGINIYNIGFGESISVEEIIKTICNVTNIKKQYLSLGKERKNEVWDLYVDITKIKNELGWQPKINFKEGIRKIILNKKSQ